MRLPHQARRALLSMVGYPVLMVLVLLGYGAMHGGVVSSVALTGLHSSVHSVTMAEPVARAFEAEAVHEGPFAGATVTAPAASDHVPTWPADHGLMAGCVLALTGLVGLVLARLLKGSQDSWAPRRSTDRVGSRTICPTVVRHPSPPGRFALCVLRT